MTKKIVIVDYGIGNIFSVERAFSRLNVLVTSDPKLVSTASHLVLPGVGAFRAGMNALKTRGLDDAIREHSFQERPLLGICLGMQMMLDESEENDLSPGLSLLPGVVKKIIPKDIKAKIPHIGWTRLKSTNCDEKLGRLVHDKWVYFVHSYHPVTDLKYISFQAEYGGIDITAMVRKDNIFGCQFHPEKSGPIGLKILDFWVQK